MTHSGFGQQWGGGSPPLEEIAGSALAAVRGHMSPARPAPPRPLTAEERQEAAKVTHCALCGGIHAAPSTPACPRLATFELDGDGKVVKGTFWGPDTTWATGRVVLAEDAAESAGEEAGDGVQ